MKHEVIYRKDIHDWFVEWANERYPEDYYCKPDHYKHITYGVYEINGELYGNDSYDENYPVQYYCGYDYVWNREVKPLIEHLFKIKFAEHPKYVCLCGEDSRFSLVSGEYCLEVTCECGNSFEV